MQVFRSILSGSLVVGALLGGCAADDAGAAGASCMDLQASQSVSQPCCPGRGIDACGANLFCAAFDGRSQPTCYPERSRPDLGECSEDRQCASGECNVRAQRCKSTFGASCRDDVGCSTRQPQRSVCRLGSCDASAGAVGDSCNLPEDCDSHACAGGFCVSASGAAKPETFTAICDEEWVAGDPRELYFHLWADVSFEPGGAGQRGSLRIAWTALESGSKTLDASARVGATTSARGPVATDDKYTVAFDRFVLPAAALHGPKSEIEVTPLTLSGSFTSLAKPFCARLSGTIHKPVERRIGGTPRSVCWFYPTTPGAPLPTFPRASCP